MGCAAQPGYLRLAESDPFTVRDGWLPLLYPALRRYCTKTKNRLARSLPSSLLTPRRPPRPSEPKPAPRPTMWMGCGPDSSQDPILACPLPRGHNNIHDAHCCTSLPNGPEKERSKEGKVSQSPRTDCSTLRSPHSVRGRRKTSSGLDRELTVESQEQERERPASWQATLESSSSSWGTCTFPNGHPQLALSF